MATWEKRHSEIARLVIVSSPKTGPRHDGEPSEISVWIKQFVESIEPGCAVIFEARAVRKTSVEIGESGFAFVKNRAAKNCMALDVEDHFR